MSNRFWLNLTAFNCFNPGKLTFLGFSIDLNSTNYSNDLNCAEKSRHRPSIIFL